MRMVYGVDETPWLRGWPPLMEWLRSNGLDPTIITRFELCPDAPEIAVTEFVLDAKGQRQLAPCRRHCVTRQQSYRINSFPPDMEMPDLAAS